MKLLIMADSNSSHTQKWVKGIAENDINILLFTFDKCVNPSFYFDLGVQLFEGKYNGKTPRWSYFLMFFSLIKILRKEKPDVVHAHYLSLYGLLVNLIRTRKFYISVWGSDIFKFPRKSSIHKWLTKRSLRKVTLIFSTSEVMKKEIQEYTNKDIIVIPFGIDTELFKPSIKVTKNNSFNIGTVKSLYPIYGIEKIINAVIFNKSFFPDLTLNIYGEGPLKKDLQMKIDFGNAGTYIKLNGKINTDEVPTVLNEIDLFCNLSDNESFGVSILEASSCGIPILATNVGGIPEVVIDEYTGCLVENEQNAINHQMKTMISMIKQGVDWGQNGRSFVIENYEWKTCLLKMLEFYK